MTRSERIAKSLNNKIRTWSKNHDKLVVGIDGYAGTGKTTINKLISEQNPDVLTVHLDDFIHHWKDRKRKIESSQDKPGVFEKEWYRYDELEKLIKAFKTKNEGYIKCKMYDYDKNEFGPEKAFDLSKKVLIIDGIFLFHPLHKISREWDMTVYLNTDFAKADKRRVAREKKKWGKNYLPEDHPDNWVQYYKEAYRRYIDKYQPQEKCEVVFSY